MTNIELGTRRILDESVPIWDVARLLTINQPDAPVLALRGASLMDELADDCPNREHARRIMEGVVKDPSSIAGKRWFTLDGPAEGTHFFTDHELRRKAYDDIVLMGMGKDSDEADPLTARYLERNIR